MDIQTTDDRDFGKVQAVLERAKEVNKEKTCAVRVNRDTVIYITEAQRADEKFMKRLWRRWGK